ncbi:hypothetical protein PPYR_10680 [Photinus pyralis]|uniref:K Homology domain-containing protein n=1 Tax=Photinus pyralis TaxID=7054 RepID=A0A1Y1MBV8_PHOPY|nr:activating signal cointegrator 1 complex subunit 1-like [Photinus pyralis]KAB0796619.1 hypothetical protein PPYR_10680 [Photinus pyralis]
MDPIFNSSEPLDITRPNVIKVDGYCFRDFQNFKLDVADNSTTDHLAPYEEHDELVNCTEIDDNFQLSVNDSGKFVIKFHVPSCFMGIVIGSRGSVRQRIEQETRTAIQIRKGGTDVTVHGENERDVITAKNRIDLILWQARDKHRLTHFISIPLISDLIKYNFDSFKSTLLNESIKINGLHPSMFQNPNKIHLTIAPLVLVDNVEEEHAVRILKECNETVIRPIFQNAEPLKICLQGVEIMNDDPTDVDVLYGKIRIEPPKYNDLLQRMADEIYTYFTNKGLVRKQFDNVKLHATLINSIFRKADKQNKKGEEKQGRKSFDASYILKKFKNYNFGEAVLNFIHLSIRFTKSEGAYYDALCTVSLK